MDNFKIEVEENKTYKQRLVSLLWYPFIMFEGGSFFIFFFTSHPSDRGIGFEGFILLFSTFTIFFLTTAFVSNALCTYYIILFEIKENHVHIIYTKKNEKFELNDSKEKFKFSSGSGHGIGRYLKIKCNDNIRIKQLNKWNWRKERAFAKTENYLRECDLLSTNFGIF